MGADRFWMGLMEGSLMAILLWLAFKLFPALSPNARAWLWRLCLLKFGISLLTFGCVSLQVLPAPPVPDDPPAAVQAGYAPQVAGYLLPATVVATKSEAPAVSPRKRAESFLKIAWIAGALLCLVQFLVATLRTSRLRREARPTGNGRLQQLLHAISVKARLKRPPLLLLSPQLDTPSVIGGVRAAVLIPESLPQHVSEQELELILAHEVAHIKRRDLAWNFAAWCIRTGLCFHPLVWFAARELHIAQESATDQEAVRVTGAAVSVYGEMLLRAMTRSQGGSGRPAPALSLFDSYRSAHRRLNAMKNFSSRPSLRKSATTAAVFALTLGLLPTYLLVPAQAATSPHHRHRIRHYAHRAAQQSPRVVRVDVHSVIYLDDQKVGDVKPEIVVVPATATVKLKSLTGKELRAVIRASKNNAVTYTINAGPEALFSRPPAEPPKALKGQSLFFAAPAAPPALFKGQTVIAGTVLLPPQPSPQSTGAATAPVAPQALLITPAEGQTQYVTGTIALTPPSLAAAGGTGSASVGVQAPSIGLAPAAPAAAVPLGTSGAGNVPPTPSLTTTGPALGVIVQSGQALPTFSRTGPPSSGQSTTNVFVRDFAPHGGVAFAPPSSTFAPPKGGQSSPYQVYFGKGAGSGTANYFVAPPASPYKIQSRVYAYTLATGAATAEGFKSVIVLKTSKGDLTLKAPKGMVFEVDGSTIEVVPAPKGGN